MLGRPMAEYMAFMKKAGLGESALDSIALGGYHNGLMALQVLKRAGNDLTRENLIRQATTLKDVRLPTLLPDMVLGNSPEDYRFYHSFQLSRFTGKGWEKVETVKAD